MPYSDDGHLTYYREHGISPVRYDLTDIRAHFERRAALYRQLGLPEVAIRGRRVLEVAPGSGHNSLFLARSNPASLDLVEPNPAGIEDIRETYRVYQSLCPQSPVLHELPLQEFHAATPYDLVFCENWLGALPEDRKLIRKLAAMVSPGGVLTITIVPYPGFAPNVLRRLLADKITTSDMDFETRTGRLVKAFGPHLATMKSMTRSHADWVRDCMINPHYLNVALPLDVVLEDIGADMEMLGTSPVFYRDWRWFKSLHGGGREGIFNEQFRDSYMANCHNFADHRFVYPARTATDNSALETACRNLHRSAVDFAKSGHVNSRPAHDTMERVLCGIDEMADELSTVSPHFRDALQEAGDALSADHTDVSRIANQQYFSALFGRETVYVSLTRRVSEQI